MARVHMRGTQAEGEIDLRTSVCRMVGVVVVEDVGKVTCRLCLRELVPVKVEPVFESTGEAPAVLGTSLLDRSSFDLLMRLDRADKTGEELDTGPRWGSLDKAFEQFVRVRDDGSPIRSPSLEPFVQGSTKSHGAFGGREDIIAIERALDAAFLGPRTFGHAVVSVERCRMVLELRLGGQHAEPAPPRTVTAQREVARLDEEDLLAEAKRLGVSPEPSRVYAIQAARSLATALGASIAERDVTIVAEMPRGFMFAASATTAPRRRRTAQRVPVSAEELAAKLTALIGERITEHNVAQIVKEGRTRMRRSLERAGMLRAPTLKARETKEGDMPRPPKGYDCDTWPEIADIVGLHEDTCRKLAKRADDPLPVSNYFGRIVGVRAELEEWAAKQVTRKAGAA